MGNLKQVTLPPEIYEYILRFLDGPTLLQAELVNAEWRTLVQYVAKKYNLWETRFKNDLPANDVFALTSKYGCVSGPNKWETLFRNWVLWQSLQTGDYFQFSFEMPNDICCAKISGGVIVVAEYSGKLLAITETNKTIFSEVVTDNRNTIQDLHFFNEKKTFTAESFQHTHVLVLCERTFSIYKLEPLRKALYLANVEHLSVYEDIVVYSSANQGMKVQRLVFKDEEPSFRFITCCVLYSPETVKSLCVYKNFVTIITANNVMSFDYTLGIHVSNLRTGPQLMLPSHLAERYWSFYNEIAFCKTNTYLYYTTCYFDAPNVIRQVNTTEILGAPVCDIYLHGSLLILAMCSGTVYLYLVTNWSDLDFSKFDHKIIADKNPICSIDVQELDNEHRLIFVSSDLLVQYMISDVMKKD